MSWIAYVSLCVVIIQVRSGLHKITAGRRDRFSFRDVGKSVDQVRGEWGKIIRRVACVDVVSYERE